MIQHTAYSALYSANGSQFKIITIISQLILIYGIIYYYKLINKISNYIMIRTLRTTPITCAQNKAAAALWGHRSDHLPVYGKVNRCLFGTENTLNNAYIPHIEQTPFWNQSAMIHASKTPSKRYLQASVREELVALSIRKRLIEEQSIDVLGIQECSDRMVALFQEMLEPEIAVIVGNGNWNNHVVTFVKKDRFAIENVAIRAIFRRNIPRLGGLVWDEWRPAVDVTLRSQCGFSERIRFVNLHISSAGQKEAYKVERLDEVRKYLDDIALTSETPLVVMGDFNAGEELLEHVFNGSYKSIRMYHTQIECIPENNPQLVALDDIRVRVARATDRMIEQQSIPLDVVDQDADKIFQDVIVPLNIEKSSNRSKKSKQIYTNA